MSIATLVVSDLAHSGCHLCLLPATVSADGTPFHPFQWHDNYWRPVCLPDKLEKDTVECAASCFEILSAHEHCPQKQRNVVEGYYKLLTEADEVVRRAPAEAYTSECLHQLSLCRVECLYNLALLHMLDGLSQHAQFGGSSSKLCEAASMFETLLNAPFRPNVERHEVSESNLRAMAAVCIATAHELAVAIRYKDNYFYLQENAMTAHRAAFYFEVVAAVCERSMSIPDVEALKNFALIKTEFYKGLCVFIRSMEVGTTKGNSRRRKACLHFDEALQHTLQLLPGERRNVEEEIEWFMERARSLHKLVRKGMAPEAAIASVKKRCDEHLELYPTDVRACLPAESTPFHRIDTSAALRQMSVAAELSTPVTTGIVMESSVDVQDLRVLPCTVSVSGTAVRYQEVRAVVSLHARERTVHNEDGAGAASQAHVAMVFLIDINFPDAAVRTALVEMAAYAIRTANFSIKDAIALVQYDGEGLGNVTLSSADEDWVQQVSQQIVAQRGRGRFEGSKGTCITHGILAATAALEKLDSALYAKKKIVVVSDGYDSTAYSNAHNWELIKELQRLRSPVAVDAYSLGAADDGLLMSIARDTKGRFGTFKAMKDESMQSAVRLWFVACIADAVFLRATGVRLNVECGQGVLARPLTARGDEPNGDAPSTSVSAQFPDFSVGSTSHAILTFCVPADLCKRDVVTLGSIELSYADAITLQPVQLRPPQPLKNTSWTRIIDCDLYGWLMQMTVDQVEGQVEVSAPTSTRPALARGGEVVYIRDSIMTRLRSAMTMTSYEGVSFDLGPRHNCSG